MLRGTAWSVALRWGVRLIGLVSVVILARLLTPEDFGIVAMAGLTIGLISMVGELGVQLLLIRQQDAGRDECDTAWTLKILQGIFVAAVLVAVAPFAANYFDDNRIVDVMYVLAVGAVFDGAQNIGMVLARKELDFSRDFRFNLYVRMVSFVLTVGLAIALKSYWGLVLGRVLASFASIPLSFAMHPYRPRLSLACAGQYLKFGASIVPLRVGQFLSGKVDALIVGGFAGTSQLGVYNVASDLSMMLTEEIVGPLGRGLMPNYAKLSHDPAALAAAYNHVLRVAAIVVLPLGMGLSVLSGDVVLLILGDQWAQAGQLVEMLALYSMLVAIMHIMSNQILIVSGHERTSAVLMWVRLAILVPVIVAAGQTWGVDGIAVGRLVVAVCVFPLVVVVLTRSIPLTVIDVLIALWRPLLAAITMALMVARVHELIAYALVPRLLIEVGAGAVVYVATLLALWWISGRPSGIEATAVAFVVSRAGKSQAQ